jgi:Ser-tRNA(Ala) deacylase AlaX
MYFLKDEKMLRRMRPQPSTTRSQPKQSIINQPRRTYSMTPKQEYTKKLYWHNTYLYAHKTRVVATGLDPKEGHWLQVAESIYRPQGGGQPSDEGNINGIKITKAAESQEPPSESEYDLAVLTYFLEKDPQVKVGDFVEMNIDKEKRLLNSALHTAGHIVAGSLRKNHKYKAQVGANHFPSSAKVEFYPDGAEPSVDELLQESLAVIKEGRKITASFRDIPEVHQVAGKATKARCIEIPALHTEPCSGTHLAATNEIATFAVRNKKEGKDKGGKKTLIIGYDATFGFFKEQAASAAQKAAKSDTKAKVEDYKKSFAYPNGEISFMLKKGELKAVVSPKDGKPYEVAKENIHINLHDLADHTILLSDKNSNWQKSALEKIADVSLAFSGSIVITKLSDWSFEKAPTPTPSLR